METMYQCNVLNEKAANSQSKPDKNISIQHESFLNKKIFLQTTVVVLRKGFRVT
jgi:hypothetical protein